MKKILMAFTATTALLLSIKAKSFAQANGTVAMVNVEKSTTHSSFAASGSSSASNLSSTKMGSRALKNFSRSFKNVSNADWLITSTGGFVAYYQEDGVKGNAYFNSKGNSLYSIKRYSEEQLPAGIKQQVKDNYSEYDIICGEEIISNGRSVWLLHIQSRNFSKTVRVADNEVEVIEELES